MRTSVITLYYTETRIGAIAVVSIFTKINITTVLKNINYINNNKTFKLLHSLTIIMKLNTVTIGKTNTIIVIITNAKKKN